MPKTHIVIFAFLAALLLWGGVAYNNRLDKKTEQATQEEQERIQMERENIMKKFIREDVVVGNGAEAINGKMVTVHYAGTLEDGTKFDSSYDRGQPFEFTLGEGSVIQGWDLGLLGMKVGGKRLLTIPPELGYGASGYGPIPPQATLTFTVELLGVK